MLFIYLLAEGEEFFWVFIYLPFFFGGIHHRRGALSENRMTPSQPRIGQINAKLTCDFFIQNSYERQSDAPPHVRASPCAAAAWIDLKLCTAAICDFRHQIHAIAPREKDGKTVFRPLGNFARIRRIWLVNDGLKVKKRKKN